METRSLPLGNPSGTRTRTSPRRSSPARVNLKTTKGEEDLAHGVLDGDRADAEEEDCKEQRGLRYRPIFIYARGLRF